MRAADGTGQTESAEEVAPRLKRVRKRRKDASSIATAGEDEDDAEASSEQAPAAVDFESARAEAAAAVALKKAGETPVAPQKVEKAVEGAPRSSGDTRGTKVRRSLMFYTLKGVLAWARRCRCKIYMQRT